MSDTDPHDGLLAELDAVVTGIVVAATRASRERFWSGFWLGMVVMAVAYAALIVAASRWLP